MIKLAIFRIPPEVEVTSIDGNSVQKRLRTNNDFWNGMRIQQIFRVIITPFHSILLDVRAISLR